MLSIDLTTRRMPLFFFANDEGEATLNAHYQTGLPVDLAELLDAKAEPEGWCWQSVYKFALWLGLVAVEDRGGCARPQSPLATLPANAPKALAATGVRGGRSRFRARLAILWT